MTTFSCVLILGAFLFIKFLHGDRTKFVFEENEVLDGPYRFTVQHIAEAQIDLIKPNGFRFLLFNATGWADTIVFIGAINKNVKLKHKSDIAGSFEKDSGTFPFCYNYEYVNHEVELNKTDYLQFYLNVTGHHGKFVYATPIQTLTVGKKVVPNGVYCIEVIMPTKKPKKEKKNKRKKS